MLDQALLTKEFPFVGKEIFLNSSYITVPPVRTQLAYYGFMDQLVNTYADDFIRNSEGKINEARRRLAEVVNASPEEIAFVKNTTEGIGILSQGLSYNAGDNVVVIDQEHSANLFGWIKLQQKGVELRIVRSRDDAVVLNDIVEKINEHTRIVAISAVQFSTGFAIDLELLGRVCKDFDVILSVDAIQALGRKEIDVKKMNISYLASGGNKGLFGILGAGFVYCSSDIIDQITPPYASYQSVESVHAQPAITTDFSQLRWHKDARRLESGNLNHAGIAALSAGTSLVLELGIKNIQAHILALEKMLRDKLVGVPLKVVTPDRDENRSGVVCIYYPLEKEDKVISLLQQRHIHVTMRGGYIRISFHAFNTQNDVAQIAAAIWDISEL